MTAPTVPAAPVWHDHDYLGAGRDVFHVHDGTTHQHHHRDDSITFFAPVVVLVDRPAS